MAVALSHLKDRTIAVFGLARAGLATVQAARRGGAAKIWAWDDKTLARAGAEAAGASIPTPGRAPGERGGRARAWVGRLEGPAAPREVFPGERLA